ncbi:hypothetical protein BH23BAC1_BH23BAC1_05760 [soil metagenome]
MHFSEEDLIEIHKRSLSWNGTNPAQVHSVFVKFTPGIDKKVSNWSQSLNEILKASPESGTLIEDKRNRQVLDEKFPLPFQEILLPFIKYGRETLKARVKENYSLLNKSAHIDLERTLLDWLSYIISLPMEQAFSTFRASCQTSLSRLVKSTDEQPSVHLYNKFIQCLCEGALLEYLKEYAVLAKLLTTGLELWKETVAELISRFKKDKYELEKCFNKRKELGKIINVQASLFDGRTKGRFVIILSFESGLKIVYKPRNLGIEHVYNELIKYLISLGSPVNFKSFKVLNFKNYGWAEFVTDIPLKNEFEAQAYYKRTGALLCLVHILGATDLHFENIIGHGEHPVLIDLETLMHPRFPGKLENSEIENASKEDHLLNSVLRTGFLPYGQLFKRKPPHQKDGLGIFEGEDYYIENICWENINTDKMQVRKKRINISSIELGSNPLNKNYPIHEFIDKAVKGFSEMYKFLMANKKCILSSSYWDALSKVEVRYIFRPTIVYNQLRQNLLHPEFLRNGNDRSKQLEILKEKMTTGEASSKSSTLIEAELDALERLNIPHFSIFSDSNSVILPGGNKVSFGVNETSFTTASNKLDQLNNLDLKRQIKIIEESLCTKYSKSCIDKENEKINI